MPTISTLLKNKMTNFINNHLKVFNDIENIVSIVKPEEYSIKLSVLGSSTIGQHIRHILEFYVCLVADKQYVNYDERERNLLIENCQDHCKNIINDLRIKLQNMDLNKVLFFKDTESKQMLQTSYARELVYLTEHSIHHFALIKIGLQQLNPDLILDENFGYAASTIKYKENSKIEECVS